MKKLQLFKIYLIILTIFFASCSAVKTWEPVPPTVSPAIVHQGSVAALTLTDSTAAEAEAHQDNATVIFYRDNATDPLRAMIGVDLEEPPGSKELRVSIVSKDGRRQDRIVTYCVIGKTFPSQHLSLHRAKGVPGRHKDERIEREKEIVKNIFARIVREKLWSHSFIRPINGRITTDFGTRRFINNEPKNHHTGIDIKAPAGTPIAASAAGRVVYTGNFFFSGNSVFIDHGTGICTMYFHLASIAVQPGQRVRQGDTIGAVGSTGRSTGPHLHWGVRVNNKRVDPLALIALFKSTTTRIAGGLISP